MGDNDKRGLVVLASGGAGVAVGAIIAKLTSSKAVSASGIVTLDIDTRNALAAMLEQQAQLLELLAAIDNHIVGLNIGGICYPSNAEGAIIDSITCAVANFGYQLPRITIPDTMSLVIKAHPANALASLIYVAVTSAIAPPRIWPLTRNESIAWRVKSGSTFWVSTDTPGSIAVFTVEQR